MAGSICDILPSVAAVLGMPDAEDRLSLAETIGRPRRIALMLVDGLGHHLLPAVAEHAPLLAALLHGRTGVLDELSCTFPSTTPTSLVSLGTGVPPGQHGVLGFTVRVPATGKVLTHILWRDDPRPGEWAPQPTWFERLARAGLGASAVLPTAFAGGGLTDAAYRGARFCGVPAGADYPRRVLEALRATRGVVYGYTSVLDTAAHLFGIGSPQWCHAATEVDALLTRIVEELPEDAVLLVTADHGGLNIGPDARYDLDTDGDLRTGISQVAGEPRVRYLHVESGATEDVVAAWESTLGERAEVLRRDEAIARGLFGPVLPEHRARIGDVVVICTADIAVLATAHEPPEVAALIGLHGGMTRAETAIPLLAFSG